MSDPFYKTKEWHRIRFKVIARYKRETLSCAYCNQPFKEGDKYFVDHINNRKQFPHLALDLSNLACVHQECNTKKYFFVESNDRPTIGLDGYPEGWGG